MAGPSTSAAARPDAQRDNRLASLDAFRGFVLLALATMGLGIPQVARSFPDSAAWQFAGYQLSHVAWRGCAFWDLIQPAFMLMAGVSMAYSYGRRKDAGIGFGRLLSRTVYRSVTLAMLGILLAAQGPQRTNIVLTNVLTQIGLGYVFLFLLWNCSARTQWLAAALILAGDWALFYQYPTRPAGFDYGSVGVPADWPHLEGAEAHWDKNTNVAAAVDRVILNWLPRQTRFEYSSRGYTTLNFVPSLTTMIFGLLVGGLLRGDRRPCIKLLWLVAAGLCGIALGAALDASGYCPIVKRIWTPSWTVYSAGWVLLMLAGFYAAVDLGGFQRPAWPLIVAGVNPLAIYCLSQAIGWPDDVLARVLENGFGSQVFTLYGTIAAVYAPIVQMTMIVAAEWLICLWLYRRKVFLRL